MKKVFYGFLLVFLDVNITLGNNVIGLIPDFLGYIILSKGLTEMESESINFKNAKPITTFMIAYSGICYFIDFVGLQFSSVLNFVLGIAGLIVGLYVAYLVIQGIKETEIRYNRFLNSNSLKSAWTVMAVTDIAAMLMTYIVPAVSVLSILCGFVAGICFLVHLNRSANYYIDFKGGYGGTF